MPKNLRPGIHERLVTDGVDAAIAKLRAGGAWVRDGATDTTLRAELLARHIYDLARDALDALGSLDDADTLARQMALTNRLVEVLRPPHASSAGTRSEESVANGLRLLKEVQAPGRTLAELVDTPRPLLSLRRSGLLVNASRDYQFGAEVAREIESADRIDLICAFVRFSGVRILLDALKRFRNRGGVLRVITSIYTGSTERRALDALAALGAEIKISFETQQTRLHAKAWLFHRNSDYDTAYVGSSNLTHTALLDGLEWNVRLARVDNAPILDRFAATFEQYWAESEFAWYDAPRDGDRVERLLAAQRQGEGAGDEQRLHDLLSMHLAIEPRPVQIPMLEALAAERSRGHRRNLLVAATGSGKTWVAAFDYCALRKSNTVDSLLFVAHRDEILRQSQLVFQLVLGDATFGERLVAGERPARGRHVFASIQSLDRQSAELTADEFDMVIIDEFHHAAARSYDDLLQRLRPRILLGLTATPERADGRSILAYFDERIAFEQRLWDALDQGVLRPFHYFGVSDETDLSGVKFERRRYAVAELEKIYTGDDRRARNILQAVAHYLAAPRRMKALGFCVSVAHARFMARKFEEAGLSALAVDGSSSLQERRTAIDRLRRGGVNAVFTVDLFNEGVDIPEVDTVLLLRPTESATVFLQQLGRGLRRCQGKSVLTVLDFIGAAHKQFRFDIRYRALIGGTRREVAEAVEADFPLLPAGCSIQLERVAKDHVLRNLREAVGQARGRLVLELRRLGPDTTLSDFLAEMQLSLFELYARPADGRSFTQLRRLAGFEQRPATPHEERLLSALGRLLHTSDDLRLGTWRRWLSSPSPPDATAFAPCEQRLAAMLFTALGHRKRPLAEQPRAFGELWESVPVIEELRALLEILDDRSRMLAEDVGLGEGIPLRSHTEYGLYELVAALELVGPSGTLRETREGVLRAPRHDAELLFVTLDKADGGFAPNTRYDDYPISPTHFHWETQNTVSSDGAVARRYREHEADGLRIVLCVRQRKKDARGETVPYTCLGLVRFVQEEGERPVRIVWKLDRAMPGELFQSTKLAAG